MLKSSAVNKIDTCNFIEPATHRSTHIKVKIEILEKNSREKSEMYVVIALNPKILYMLFLTAQLNRTLIKKIINIKDTQKCEKYQEI